jgi:catechol 2,3-dioxygenase
VRRGYSGLYHLAIHLPDEPALARVLGRLLVSRSRVAPTDHIIGECDLP